MLLPIILTFLYLSTISARKPKDDLKFGIYQITNEKTYRHRKVTILFRAVFEQPDVKFYDVETEEPLTGSSMHWTREAEVGYIYINFDDYVNEIGVIFGVVRKHYFQFVLNLRNAFDHKIGLPAATFQPGFNVSYTSGSEQITKITIKALKGRGIKGKISFESNGGRPGEVILQGTFVDPDTGLIVETERLQDVTFMQYSWGFFDDIILTDTITNPKKKHTFDAIRFEFLTNMNEINGYFVAKLKANYYATEGMGWLQNNELYEVFEFSVHEDTSKGPFTQDFVSAKFRHRSVSCQHSALTPCTLHCEGFSNSNAMRNVKILRRYSSASQKLVTSLEEFDFDHRAMIKAVIDNSNLDFPGTYICEVDEWGGNNDVDIAVVTQKAVLPNITQTSLQPVNNTHDNVFLLGCRATGTKPLNFTIFCKEDSNLNAQPQTTTAVTRFDEDEDTATVPSVSKPQPCSLYCSVSNIMGSVKARFE